MISTLQRAGSSVANDDHGVGTGGSGAAKSGKNPF
jgi:hypothetical protein